VSESLLEVRNLVIRFPIWGGVLRHKVAEVRAVDGISFTIGRGETLGLVGESGCGKTTTAKAICNVLKETAPGVHQQGEIIGRPLKIHTDLTSKGRREQVASLLDRVGLQSSYANRYPHEFSGGQRQRIGIARALTVRPRLVIADEPVSALDVSVQSQVINLLQDLQDDFDLTYLFVAHDLSVVRHISDRIAVMYLGDLVEIGSAETVYHHPAHPYSQALLSAVPEPNPSGDRRQRVKLKGEIPSPLNKPSGCSFHPRCPIARPDCSDARPPLEPRPSGQLAACPYADEPVPETVENR